ncbi:Pre-rRNA-processing protein esf1 [Thelohanellus kitauei]|uniref:Pre-rRNA-processing protein esf1 n=1 Tax=Thelohanellus kitauei TaxID=669202 RepID=A0A0C2IKK5_THEKT|nr:Pre-rRNA-processing protein esf1 [Thelohanellus kitauei]
MDWDNIGAADIFVLLTAFCDKKDILSVKVSIFFQTIYLSDYGRREIDHEVLHGPSVEPNKTLSFKQYYLKKRKHQFCVVQFVSSDVATKVYNLADGFEIENTSLTFDLSFVPDETTFDNRLLSECLEFPTNYTPHHFIVKALQQTNVEFEWDETDSRRLEITHKSVFREEDIVDIEKFDEFLAPPSDEDDIDKYRALLENDDAEISSETDGESGENSEYSQAPITCDQIDVPKSFKDPFLTTKPQKTKLKIEVSNLKEKNESELDLLMFDPEEPEDKHFDYAQIVKNKKTKRKSKNSKTIEEQCDDFNVNVDDKRFSALFKSSEYAIDPSSKLYKKTKNMESVLKLQTVRRKKFE